MSLLPLTGVLPSTSAGVEVPATSIRLAGLRENAPPISQQDFLELPGGDLERFVKGINHVERLRQQLRLDLFRPLCITRPVNT
jgi:hypothetical protein